ncbi:hypothetical protein ABER99_21555 [Paenibacillus glucanolyticus]|uniref:Uncharacterized protein n=1 Tax=Paenibacillus glucanolyticus TaxID=59843 RepID=A0A163GTY1_9BACL|nr:hypothetical protein [Paenibacillus glucanolyticus]KZS45149.1 hypothetical protein AWU65_03970 [Paenibacillus glucanolyticus]OMF64426.1 hypothetical protein BK142_31915 [Paenibacillus glucanolyticus]
MTKEQLISLYPGDVPPDIPIWIKLILVLFGLIVGSILIYKFDTESIRERIKWVLYIYLGALLIGSLVLSDLVSYIIETSNSKKWEVQKKVWEETHVPDFINNLPEKSLHVLDIVSEARETIVKVEDDKAELQSLVVDKIRVSKDDKTTLTVKDVRGMSMYGIQDGYYHIELTAPAEELIKK